MKAILSTAPGGPETLALHEVPEPTPAAGEVRVRIVSCALNHPDLLVIHDRYQDRPERPFAPGSEVAGVVDAVGGGVDGLRVGDRVFGATGNRGGLAEKITLPAGDCFVLPAAMSFDDASALLLTYATMMHALKDAARLAAGETLLVLGAAGGIGLASVELGKAMGARVVAVASSQRKVDLALSRGADAGVVCPAGPLDLAAAKAFKDALRAACGPQGANVVCDPVGGDYAEAALRTLAFRGRYLVIGFTAGIPRIPLNLVLLKAGQMIGVLWGSFASGDAQANRRNVGELMGLYERGLIRPFISARFPLERAPDALAVLAERRALGKVVVRCSAALA
ncbi:NADPH:quinone oxidoreductase [Burkholderia ubonensis]|uniref:NADPH:quinone oxidoreductase family protein n=1 Tax=Burkholderia ubonensis TaxID=101571 RepID=UPI0007569545|nr:NADPH:quinone oxidoreductase family protein [Burkholderia ubonensis]KWE68479.1 NADPH:quinone oxidoreductase [Burkholderia ubonensis]KWE81778.1 NADPH:quinone oxidoreductase [Burkholderia ubonensis]